MSDRVCDVVIPTRNRPVALANCLRSLAGQSAQNFGIIVVDDHSDEPLDAVVADVVASEKFAIDPCLIRLSQQSGPSAARNAGVAASSAEYVLFIDDDIVADRNLVDVHLLEVTSAENSNGHVVTRGPFVEPVDWAPNAWNLWEAQMATRGTNTIVRGDYVPTWRQFHTGNNCMSVALFRHVGGFDESFKRLEDDEFGLRLHQHQCEFRFLPAALAYHYSNRSLAAWLEIPRSYAYYTVVLDRRYPQERFLETREHKRANSNVLIRMARFVSKGRARTSFFVGLAVGVGRIAHRLGVKPLTLVMMSVAFDLSYTESLRATLTRTDLTLEN